MSDDIDFLEKKKEYCINRCDFTFHELNRVVDQQENHVVERVTKACVLCTMCGLVDDIEFGEEDGP